MEGLLFAGERTPVLPRHDASMLSVAAAVHLVLFALIVGVGMRQVRLAQAGAAAGSSIGAYVSNFAGTTGKAEPKAVPHKKPALAASTAKAASKEDDHADVGAGQAGMATAGQPGAGPVRLGSSNGLTLIKRVEPIYPSIMRSARMTGQVVLDAVIHADGTIGDVTVVRSTNGAFTQSAIDAVKQWRYTAPGFEAILSVSVNYTLT